MSVGRYAYMTALLPKARKGRDSLELELRAVLSSPVWVLETELGSHWLAPSSHWMVPKMPIKFMIIL